MKKIIKANWKERPPRVHYDLKKQKFFIIVNGKRIYVPYRGTAKTLKAKKKQIQRRILKKGFRSRPFRRGGGRGRFNGSIEEIIREVRKLPEGLDVAKKLADATKDLESKSRELVALGSAKDAETTRIRNQLNQQIADRDGRIQRLTNIANRLLLQAPGPGTPPPPPSPRAKTPPTPRRTSSGLTPKQIDDIVSNSATKRDLQQRDEKRILDRAIKNFEKSAGRDPTPAEGIKIRKAVSAIVSPKIEEVADATDVKKRLKRGGSPLRALSKMKVDLGDEKEDPEIKKAASDALIKKIKNSRLGALTKVGAPAIADLVERREKRLGRELTEDEYKKLIERTLGNSGLEAYSQLVNDEEIQALAQVKAAAQAAPSSDDEEEYTEVKEEIPQAGGSTWPQLGTGLPAMYDTQIKTILAKYPHFGGVVSRNELNKLPNKIPQGFIMNTEPRPKTGHWIACYITPDSFEVFDPLADPLNMKMVGDFSELIDRLGISNLLKFKVNNIKFQKDSSDTCAHHCILFLKNRFHKVPFITATKYDKSKQGEKKVEDEFRYI